MCDNTKVHTRVTSQALSRLWACAGFELRAWAPRRLWAQLKVQLLKTPEYTFGAGAQGLPCHGDGGGLLTSAIWRGTTYGDCHCAHERRAGWQPPPPMNGPLFTSPCPGVPVFAAAVTAISAADDGPAAADDGGKRSGCASPRRCGTSCLGTRTSIIGTAPSPTPGCDSSTSWFSSTATARLLSAPVPLLSAPVPLLSAPVPLLSAPVPLLSAPVPLPPAPVPLLSAPLPLLSAPVPLLSALVPLLSAPVPLLSAPVPLPPAPVPLLSDPVPLLSALVPLLSAPMPPGPEDGPASAAAALRAGWRGWGIPRSGSLIVLFSAASSSAVRYAVYQASVLSERRRRRAWIALRGKPILIMLVPSVWRTQWFVYRLEVPAAVDMRGMIWPIVWTPIGALVNHGASRSSFIWRSVFGLTKNLVWPLSSLLM